MPSWAKPPPTAPSTPSKSPTPPSTPPAARPPSTSAPSSTAPSPRPSPPALVSCRNGMEVRVILSATHEPSRLHRRRLRALVQPARPTRRPPRHRRLQHAHRQRLLRSQHRPPRHHPASSHLPVLRRLPRPARHHRPAVARVADAGIGTWCYGILRNGVCLGMLPDRLLLRLHRPAQPDVHLLHLTRSTITSTPAPPFNYHRHHPARRDHRRPPHRCPPHRSLLGRRRREHRHPQRQRQLLRPPAQRQNPRRRLHPRQTQLRLPELAQRPLRHLETRPRHRLRLRLEVTRRFRPPRLLRFLDRPPRRLHRRLRRRIPPQLHQRLCTSTEAVYRHLRHRSLPSLLQRRQFLARWEPSPPATKKTPEPATPPSSRTPTATR